MAKRARKKYTVQQRADILSAAQKDGLTAVEVQKRFGVTPVTYYSWRKKEGIVGRRGRRPTGRSSGSSSGDLTTQVREGVQAKLRSILPLVVREEVASYLNALFGDGPRRRRGRPKGSKNKKKK